MTPVLLAAAPAGAATNNPVLNISIFGAFHAGARPAPKGPASATTADFVRR